MKKLFMLFLISTTFFSCESEKIITNEEEFNQKQIDNVLELNGQLQRDAFTLLESSLKYKIWVDKLSRDKKYLNNEQALMIDKLLDIIDPSFFKTINKENSKFSIPLNDWIIEANKVFKRKVFIQTFVSLKSLKNISANNNEFDPINAGPSCSCNTFHDFCVFDDCASSTCDTSYKGCGLLWDYPCNGRC
jgi:hypothetical protein